MITPELTDVIIDYLHDDRRALGTCGLVCRSWLPSSRFHLFSTVQIYFFDVDTALPIICSPTSTIPPYVRHLELEDAGLEVGGYSYPQWLNEGLLKLPIFGALESLSLAHVAWGSLTVETRSSLLNMTRGLKRLELEYMQFGTVEQALDFFSSAPSLESLSLGSIQCHAENAPPTKTNKLRLKQVTFGGDSYTLPLIDWLCSQPAPSVETLNLTLVTMMQIPYISRYLKVLGPTLQHLGVSCANLDNHGEVQVAFCKEIDLAHNPSLRTITFDGLVLYADSPGSQNCLWIVDVLSGISSPFVKLVTLAIFANAPQEISSLNLPALAAFLSGGSGVSAMRSMSVRFIVWGNIDRTEAEVAITESLHDLNKQRRLEFSDHRISMDS
ncbi:hypothetical protein BD410DRAFT_792102 [Rickenella mellea]|uniref:F-box domain-containing protein n=1 Tax=Rickenella mellea TaxID=50990 RepID=A0A4Y7PWT6_9AGAM|nr:hypothetical protein BD410DRAFT_792102 [Rickenella mellea]